MKNISLKLLLLLELNKLHKWITLCYMEEVLCNVLIGKNYRGFHNNGYNVSLTSSFRSGKSCCIASLELLSWHLLQPTDRKLLFEATLKPMIIFLNDRYTFPHCRVFLFVHNWIVILLSCFSFLLNSNTNCKRSFPYGNTVHVIWLLLYTQTM